MVLGIPAPNSVLAEDVWRIGLMDAASLDRFKAQHEAWGWPHHDCIRQAVEAREKQLGVGHG